MINQFIQFVSDIFSFFALLSHILIDENVFTQYSSVTISIPYLKCVAFCAYCFTFYLL